MSLKVVLIFTNSADPGSSLFAKVPVYGFPVYNRLEDLISNDTLYILKFYGYFYNSDNDKR